ncbi:MAG TPA: hypothetical protein VLG44_01820 [Chlamydiales bacterium]|nr:hypothetical protein [Chlamydiales bacterium]
MGRFFSGVILLVVGFASSLQAFWIGNPASPAIMEKGVVLGKKKGLCLKADYLSDHVFETDFHEEIVAEDSETSHVKVTTFAALLALTLANRVDFYGILGGSQLKIDQSMYIPRRFSWGAGGRIVAYENCKCQVGVDVKYFTCDQQKPNYFVIEDMPALLITPFLLKYQEWQGAVSFCYHFGAFLPYAGVTYIHTKIEPHPNMGGIDIPNLEMTLEFESRSVLNDHKWGGVVGLTLLSKSAITLSFEGRFYNQNGVNVSAEIRF